MAAAAAACGPNASSRSSSHFNMASRVLEEALPAWAWRGRHVGMRLVCAAALVAPGDGGIGMHGEGRRFCSRGPATAQHYNIYFIVGKHCWLEKSRHQIVGNFE